MGGVTVEDIDQCFPKCNIMLRPRGTLARTLYNKYLSDEHLECLDKAEWYAIDKCKVPTKIANNFVELGPDDETEEFLENSRNLSNNVFLQIFHALVKFFCSFFMTPTSINGWLGRGSMFVLSKSQFAALSGRRPGQEGELADLGAGDGSITAILQNFFSSRVTVTEVSKAMRPQLIKRGFRMAEVDTWYKRHYDMISCLNVLDRCDKPVSLLRQIKAALKPNAKAIIAIVLPFKPYVETGTKDNKPSEELPISGKSFEDQVTSVVEDVLEVEGFKVEAWTRLPYLCQGDLNQAYYWLHDAVFVVSLNQSFGQ